MCHFKNYNALCNVNLRSILDSIAVWLPLLRLNELNWMSYMHWVKYTIGIKDNCVVEHKY